MTARTTRSLLAATLLAAITATAQVAAADGRTAAAAPTPLTIDVELTERSKGKADDELRVTLSIAQELGCASVTTDVGAASYELKVCREGGTAAAPTLTFEVARVIRGRDGGSTQRLRMSSTLAAGKRVVIGKLALGATATELAAEIK